MCLVFEATWQTFLKKLNNWKSIAVWFSLGLLYFHENTASVIVQQKIQNRHTRLNAHRISQNTPCLSGPWKAHTRWNALNKELFSGVNKRNTLSKIKIDQNCGEMRSIKMSVNLYRILEFTFRNIRQTTAYSTDSRTSKLPKGILGWASGAESSERRSPLRRKYSMTVTLCPQPTICAVGSPQVCQSPSASWLEDPLSPPPASESRTLPRPFNPAAPPWLLAPSSPPWLVSPPAPPGSLVPPPLWLCQAPPSLWLHLGPLSLWLPDPHLCLGRLSHLLRLGPPDPPSRPGSPPRASPPPPPPPSVGPMESSALPPPWLLPLSATPWAAIMAVAWVPPGSSCSCSCLSPPWLLPPPGPPWLLLSSPWILPPSSPPWTLLVVLLPVIRPPPEPPPACLPASPLPSPVTIPYPLLCPPKSPSVPPFVVPVARGRAFREGGELSHLKELFCCVSFPMCSVWPNFPSCLIIVIFFQVCHQLLSSALLFKLCLVHSLSSGLLRPYVCILPVRPVFALLWIY